MTLIENPLQKPFPWERHLEWSLRTSFSSFDFSTFPPACAPMKTITQSSIASCHHNHRMHPRPVPKRRTKAKWSKSLRSVVQDYSLNHALPNRSTTWNVSHPLVAFRLRLNAKVTVFGFDLECAVPNARKPEKRDYRDNPNLKKSASYPKGNRNTSAPWDAADILLPFKSFNQENPFFVPFPRQKVPKKRKPSWKPRLPDPKGQKKWKRRPTLRALPGSWLKGRRVFPIHRQDSIHFGFETRLMH